MKYIRSIRPSNFVLIAAAPFIVYLFLDSTKYSRSLKAIIGVETGAGPLFVGFLILAVLLAAGLIASVRQLRGDDASRNLHLLAIVAFPLQAVLIAVLLFSPATILPFVNSVVANAVDPFTSEWIQKTVRPRQLTPEVAAIAMATFRWLLVAYGVIFAVLLAAVASAGGRYKRPAAKAYAILNGLLLAYLLFGVHWGFASGIAITFRAAIFAYLFAALLGLGWTGLQTLGQGKWTIAVYGAISIALLAAAAYFFAQPRVNYVLVGTTEGRIAIVKGTPQGMADTIRFGEYDGGNGEGTRIRNARDIESALALIESSKQVSGAFVPKDADWQGLPLIWEAEFLPDSAKTPALAFSVLGLLLLVLTFGAFQHGMHPLAVGSEFFVDTIRGIPMLVIILYIGLPLSGAIKDATGGGIDLTNMTRGVIAISVGYSAYLAEIFRAGIDSIPRGQIEAAQSLGLTRWKVARLIILPQALRVVIPPLGNEFIAMIKDTSLLSILSVRDVTQRMREFQAASFLPFAPFNTAAILYVVITLACASFLKWIERRYEQKAH
ncbi:MAG: amino acid ABC transporter permease [Paracoccaceae bacterium]